MITRKVFHYLVVVLWFFGVMASQMQAASSALLVDGTVVSTSPAQFQLNWDTTDNYEAIYRRAKGTTSWGTAIMTSTTKVKTYTDANISAGLDYEYMLSESSVVGGQSVWGYLSAGVNVPMIENRGKLLLLVDQTQAVPLAAEIVQLQSDLAGDGWTVQRYDLPRMSVDPAAVYTPSVGTARLAELTSVRNTIISAYSADPTNVKQVYILGHLPVPYSGSVNYDGHADHVGAWPADAYYADVTGTWADVTVNSTAASDPRNRNVPGDGKFDTSGLLAKLKLAVGRVDLADMNTFPNATVTETDLLRRYLRKAHQYRYNQGPYANIDRRAVAIPWDPYQGGDQISVSACLGRASSVTDTLAYTGRNDYWFHKMEQSPSSSYLMGYGQGSGGPDFAAYVGNSSDFGCRPSRVVFTSVFGSYNGDWGYANNFLRAPLAGNANGDSLGLVSFWSGRPNWFLHPMAMGETIGYAALVTQNNGVGGSGYYPPAGSYYGCSHTGLMGDPALRMYTVAPPQNLQAGSSGGQVALTWTASTDTSVLGYLVYRSDSPAGPFVKLTPTPLGVPNYTDASVVSGSTYTFLVRTLKLESTPGGTFQNPSQGVAATITANSGAISIPEAPSGLQVSAADSTHINLVWTNNATNETGFRVERRTSATSTFSAIATLGVNATSYSDAGPLSAGTTFYYRIIAVGDQGDSLPSNEVYLDGAAGIFDPLATTYKADKTVGYIDVSVQRMVGAVGSVSLSYATCDSTAIAGTHYVAMNGILTWADGDASPKSIRIALLGAGQPQLPRTFNVTFSNPTGNASQTPRTKINVLISDPTATLAAPWQQKIVGGILDVGVVSQANGEIGSSLRGGNWLDTVEAGRMTYQPIAGDVVMTAKFEGPTPVHSYVPGGVALLVRADVNSTTGKMVAIHMDDIRTVNTSGSTSSGAKFYSRNGNYVGSTILPKNGGVVINNGIKPPYWMRLRRSGDTFTGEISPDGVDWTVLGSSTIADFPTAPAYGFFHHSSTNVSDFQLSRVNNISIQTAIGTIPGVATSGTTILPIEFSGTKQAGFQSYPISGSAGIGPYNMTFSTGVGDLAVTLPPNAYLRGIYYWNTIPNNGAFTYGELMRGNVLTLVTAGADPTTTYPGTYSFAISGLSPNTAYNLRIWSHYKSNENNYVYAWWNWNGGFPNLLGTVTNLSNPTYTDNNQFSTANTVYTNAQGKLLLGQSVPIGAGGALSGFELKSATLVNLAAAAGVMNGSVNLNWSVAPAATSYVVERSSSPSSGFVPVGTTSFNSFSDTAAMIGQVNYYRVKGANSFFESPYTSAASATPTSSNMDSWRVANFGTTVITPGWNGDLDMPNGDGIANIVAYALGLSVKSPNSSLCLPFMTKQELGGSQFLTYSFAHNMSAVDLQISVEVASDLNGPWSQIDPFVAANQVSVSPNVPQQGVETIVVKDTQAFGASDKRFMRLRVVHP